MCDLNLAILVVIRKTQDQIDFTWRQRQFFGVADNLAHVRDWHPAVFVDLKTSVREKVITELLDVNVHYAAAGQVEANLVKVASEVAILDLVIAELHDVVAQQQVDLLDVQVACVVEDFAHLVESNLAGVLLGLGISVESLESALQDQRDLRDLHVEHVLEGLFVDFFGDGGLLGKHLVSGKESLDRVNTDRNEVCPCDISDVVLVSKSQKYADVVLTKIISGQRLESIEELLVGELAARSNISLGKKQSQSALKRLDEAWRLNIDLLRLVQFFV